ncbi:hypothetical protein QT972_27945 [Microcoleus sp. herbarium7]|uniref:hypothetical protein n=1 Tax=Microcoleus sp. herbarium7 TaxID=3055435 RepID=UPI002FD1CD48
MTLAKEQITDSSSNSGLSNFRITIERLIELLDLEAEDEYGILRPTEYAFRTAMKLVVEAYDRMGNSFPKASTSPNKQGSIRLAWENTNADRAVRLICPINADRKSYIYHVSGESGSKDITSAALLVDRLKWFNEA